MRLDEFRSFFEVHGVDAVLVTNPANCTYLSGFTGSSGLLFVTRDQAFLITDFRYVDQALNQSGAYGFKVVQHGSDLFTTLEGLFCESNVSHIGFECEDVTFCFYEKLRKVSGSSELIPLKGMVDPIRMIKDDNEISLIEHACHIGDMAFERVLSFIKPGVSELEIAAEIETFFLSNGVHTSFDTIVASGLNGSMPHAEVSDKKICNGEFVTMDFGCSFRGYKSDMTRTVMVGKPTLEQREIYDLVLKAQLKGLQAAKNGAVACDVDMSARDVIVEAGHGNNFGHSLGHGVGLEIHEKPSVSPSGNVVLRPGMVFSIEPGVYIPGWGGVRIEDLVVLTDRGLKIMTKSPKELIQL